MNHYQYDALHAYAMEPLATYLGTPLAYDVADFAGKLSGAAARLDHEKNQAMELWACRDLTPQEKAAAHLLAVISNHRAISWWREPDTPDGTDPLPALQPWQEERLRKATINAAHAYAAFLPERQAAALVTLVPQPALKKSPTSYFYLMHPRLASRTLWTGGMLVDTDLVTLEEAARFASKHAGTEITPNDFLRAAGCGQITLRAIVHCRAKVQKFDGGIFCNAGQANENIVPAGAITNLPLTACRHLAAAGRASWRTFDGFERVNGELMGFTNGLLTDDEPDFETVPSDCRLMGDDVHALADAFIEEPEPQPAPPTVAQATETKEQRQDRRLKACIDDGLPMDTKAALSRLPDGVGDVADREGVTRQAFSTDVKAALKRRESARREGKAVHCA